MQTWSYWSILQRLSRLMLWGNPRVACLELISRVILRILITFRSTLILLSPLVLRDWTVLSLLYTVQLWIKVMCLLLLPHVSLMGTACKRRRPFGIYGKG